MESLVRRLADARVADVLVPGWVAEGEPIKVEPWTWTAYLEFADGGLLRAHAEGSTAQVRLEVVPEVTPPIEWEGEDETLAVTSLGHLFLHQAYNSYRITALRWAENEESDPPGHLVGCMEFEFERRWRLFVDPSWFFGLHLSGPGAYEQWVADDSGNGWILRDWSRGE
ncbi:hypothetical protein LX16_1794 [Stackebrandtia albiflava]|uniref:Uncharacterized protein n=1 Tax=Stackebrandtia albiflava TaxID=406432 RepID=A0A562VDY4_9ACTN|nr:hypothetical protein [Stackebrandtia albiflava]TWJ16072.1 hypothetical protein LX16_1794 [Stackebrandtia albiflava]